MRIHSQHRDRSGFTLIEVMIAVVVLATGLLAMAALQAKLAANSADAKARSRIAALITSVIDKERAQGYNGIVAFGPLTASTGACLSTADTSLTTLTLKIRNDINCAQSDAGVSGIALNQVVDTYRNQTAGGVFVKNGTPSTTIYGEYKQIKLTAGWTDATGTARSLAVDTITSNLNLNTNTNTVLAQNLTASGNLVPVVHELNPANTAGVIPIAIGDNTNAASTNPKPTVSTSGANSTTFNTLTYTQGANDTSATSTIQKRVETEVAECVCQGSSSNPFASNTLLGQYTFRPTYWNGTQYTSPAIVTGGVPRSSAATSITQSSECDVCCRDHNDTGIASGQVKYDAVTGDTNRYKVVKSGNTITTPISLATSGSPAAPVVANVQSDAYLDACRMIRVDGLWRVATDIEASHVGLIATNDEQGTTTNPGTPYPAKQTSYETFVVSAIQAYLTSALPTAGSPNWATFLSSSLVSLFNTNAPDVPTTNPVVATTTAYRYLHAHGLYIDHLEKEALDKLNAVYSSTCPSTATNYPTCLLPYMPFSTINISGLASWTDTNDTVDQAGTTPLGGGKKVLSLGSGTNSNTSTCTSSTAFGGCVTGLTGGYANATATIAHSNSGIAASIAVSPYERIASNSLTASQQFKVTSANASDLIYAQIYGPDLKPSGFSATQQFPTAALNSLGIAPTVTWAMSTTNGACGKNTVGNKATPNPYSCGTTVALATPVSVTVSGYNRIIPDAATSGANPCNSPSNSFKNKTFPLPGLICYKLSTATLTTDAGSGTGGTSRIDCGATPTPSSCYTISTPYGVANSKQSSESTTVTIGSVNGSPVALSNTYLNLTYIANGSAITSTAPTCGADGIPVYAPPASCP